MKLINCQAFEYLLLVTADYYERRQYKFRSPKIVWNLNHSLITADTLILNKFKQPMSYPIESNGDINQYSISLTENKNNLFKAVRHDLFNKYNLDYLATGLIQNSYVLFDQAKKISMDLDLTDCEPNGNKIFNVKFLESKVEVPFLEINNHDLFEPASLISEN